MSLEEDQILHLSFNQDLSCVSCGTNRGFVIYDTHPVKVRFQQKFGSGVGIVQVLYDHNVAALVGGGKHELAPPNKCLIWDDAKKKTFCQLEYVNCVRSVSMSRDTGSTPAGGALAVATDDTVRVYDFGNELNQLYKYKTGPNPKGLCELSLNPNNPIVLTKTRKKGQVAIIDFKDPQYQKKPKAVIDCCKTEVHMIRLNADATKFAVTSELGTIIRIYETETCNKIAEVRRGTNYATVQNIFFSDDSKFLLVSSDQSTLHIYSLCDQFVNETSLLSFMSAVGPSIVGSTWSCAKITVPSEHYIAGITKSKTNEKTYDVNVFMYNGHYMHYLFYPEKKSLKLESEGEFYEIEKPTPTSGAAVAPAADSKDEVKVL